MYDIPDHILVQDINQLNSKDLNLVAFKVLGPIKFTIDSSDYRRYRVDINVTVSEVRFVDYTIVDPRTTANNLKTHIHDAKMRMINTINRFLCKGEVGC